VIHHGQTTEYMSKNYAQFQSALVMLDRMYDDLDVSYGKSFPNRSDELIDPLEALTQEGHKYVLASLWFKGNSDFISGWEYQYGWLSKMIRLLCFADLHLGPSDPEYDWERPVCDEEPDVIVTVGDVIDDNVDHASDAAAGQPYEARGRGFFEYLDSSFECPVLAIPGNHDPVDCTDRLIDGLDSVTMLHEQSLTTSDIGITTDSDKFAFVGWGAEQFDLQPTFDYLEYPAVDPRHQADHDSFAAVAANCAANVEEAVAKYLLGKCSAIDAAAELGVDADSRSRFEDELAVLETQYHQLKSLLREGEGTPLLFTHKTPYNVDFDIPRWSEHLHVGSLPAKLAAVATDVPLVVCGHYHTAGLDVITRGQGHTYVSNHGSPGVATIELTPGTAPHVDHWVRD